MQDLTPFKKEPGPLPGRVPCRSEKGRAYYRFRLNASWITSSVVVIVRLFAWYPR